MQVLSKISKLIKVLIIIVSLTFSSCTTKKNTFVTRSYHNLTSKFNLYFNGNESLKAGLKKIDKTYKEDYSQILPIFTYEDETVSAMLTADMDRSIKKCAKTIKIV